MTRRLLFLTLSALFFAAPALRAEAPPTVTPESVGLSSERLQRLHAGMQQYVDQGRVAGIVTYVARSGRLVDLAAFGKADVESGRPMQKDTIFRIASQTKALTSVSVMMLVEEGKIGLADPVSRFIPAFKKTTVALPAPPGAVPGSPVAVVPAKREITIRDLLTHTAGISYGYGPAQELWKAAGIQGWYLADRSEPVSAVVERMAALPMDAQPGEKYVYGYNTDILGVVVEKVSGQTLAEFIQKRIAGPLGLVDTQFYLPPAQKERLATVYSAKEDGTIERGTDPQTGRGHYVEGPRVAFAGGAGLLSTALPPDDVERRRDRRRAPPGSEDRRAHDREPRGNPVRRAGPERRRARLRSRLRRDRGRRQDRPVRHRRRLRLGRRLPHHVLGGPEGEARRAAHDPAPPGGQLRPARAVPRARLPVDRGPADGGPGRRPAVASRPPRSFLRAGRRRPARAAVG
jgi:CubicO group peptidase (beta-lactamase class C family)